MTVLLATDLSPITDRTLAAVRACCAGDGLRVVVLHVAEPDPSFVGYQAGPDVVRDQVAAEYRRERHQVEQIAAALRDEGIDAIGLTVQGAIVKTIVAEAEKAGADLVAVGSHGHGATYDLAIGSISAGVIRASRVPVLVATPAR